jgi:hypothetical protein
MTAFEMRDGAGCKAGSDPVFTFNDQPAGHQACRRIETKYHG